jgi:ankyrin repeat protein
VTIQEEFENAIYVNDLHKTKLLLENKNVSPSTIKYEAIIIASQNGFIDIVKLLLKDKRIDPSVKNCFSLCLAAQNNHLNIVKLLLKDSRVNQSKYKIEALLSAARKGRFLKIPMFQNINSIEHIKDSYDDIIIILWSDKQVKIQLKKNNIELYNKLIQKDIKKKVNYF